MTPVYIRVDGNDIIATGHVMRCLSIAEQLKQLDMEVVFLVADTNVRELIQLKGFPVDVLHTTWNDLDGEVSVLRKYLQEKGAKVLLLDSYYVTENYMRQLSEEFSVVYIDDLKKFVYPVHTVINYYVWGKAEDYGADQYEGLSTRFLLGGAYVPLREEFFEVPCKIKETASKVLITTGGTDMLNVTGQLLAAVMQDKELSDLEYHVIVGCFNRHKEGLYGMKDRYPNIYLHENVTNMAQWMETCDMAVSAGGSTLYELCASGTPTICLEIADNQKGAYIWEEKGYMIYAGNAAEDMPDCIGKCIKGLKRYLGDRELRQRVSENMQSLIDGKGAMRIARYLADCNE